MPTRQQVSDALEQQLQHMATNGPAPDVLTFAGNGEPTLHPHFPEIVEDVMAIRDHYFPQTKISVLSNSTQIHRPEVRKALLQTDNPIMKLDTVCADYIRLLDRPQGHYEVEQIATHLAAMSPKVIIQTMFLGGEFNGQCIDNTTDQYVQPWLQTLTRIKPRQVMIYTIDRETPVSGLLKATHEQLDNIAQQVRDLGIDCSVSY